MPDLVIDTTRCPDKFAGVVEMSVLTPFSSTSIMSPSFLPEAGSNLGSGSLSPVPDVHVKAETSTSPSNESIREPLSPSCLAARRKHRPDRETGADEEHKRLRVNERSKTGCFTCRRRKKKCDETKPACNNCTKTNYACEGYPSRKQYNPDARRGSRQKSDDGHETDRNLVLPFHPNLPTFPAVENEDDHLFLKHYIQKTSRILSITDSAEGSHLLRISPSQHLQDRQLFHVGAAISSLRRRLSETVPGDAGSALIMASMIFQFLMSKNDASHTDTPQAHLKAAKAFLQAPQTPFWRFAWSFCRYHEFSTSLSSLPGSDPRPSFDWDESPTSELDHDNSIEGGMQHNFNVSVGIVDIPFMTLISKITTLRDKIRQRQLQRLLPSVHYSMLTTADELGRDIAQWRSGQPEGSARYVAAELYRRASLLYLLRTVRAAASRSSRTTFATCIQQGVECLQLLPRDGPVQSGLLLPTFILGCGAFEAQHRIALGHALDTIEAYSGFGNVQTVRDILQCVWMTMDAGDVERSWDWETLTKEMGYTALIT